MPAAALTIAFAAALCASLLVRAWLATRQMRQVATCRDAVPPAFRQTVTLASHQRAADYTLAKGRLGMLSMAWGALVLLGWTLLGGLDALNQAVATVVLPRLGPLAYQLVLLGAVAAIGGMLELPFDLYTTFRLEQRFGFNRMTPRLWLADRLRDTLLGVVIGAPIAALVLWLMGAAGGHWWLWAWGAWMVFNIVLLLIAPTVIAPLYNQFKPLADESLKRRVEGLLTRCGFKVSGLFVMDGSKRSAHSNAYFTGFGASKRVVFFDTLLAQLSPGELDAVLAHELGHLKHRHVLQRIVLMFGLSLVGFALLGSLSTQPGFYFGLGVRPLLNAPNDAVALVLFLFVVPVFGFFVSPFYAGLSRRQEFEADAYACRNADAGDLAAALLKLHKDNATTLTPDPLFVRFYYSHPPASERLAALHRPAAPLQATPS